MADVTPNETDTLLAESNEVELVSGLTIEVQRIKTRALLKLMKILTKGNLDFLSGLSSDSEDVATRLIAGILTSIPEAEDETIEFVQSVTQPTGLVANPHTKAQKQENEEKWEEFFNQMIDPELEDLVEIISKIVEIEAPHIEALGKKVALLFQTQTSSSVNKTKKN